MGSIGSQLIYRGPSVFDPNVTIIATLVPVSSNAKTGPMSQVFIIRDDAMPTSVKKAGDIFPICGRCPVSNFCYVQPYRGVNDTWKKWHGKDPVPWTQVQGMLGMMQVRIGAYGDPAALPPEVFLDIVRACTRGSTCYTHGQHTLGLDRIDYMRPYSMLSVESEADALRAQMLGWRTYRVKLPEAKPMRGVEATCPYELTGKQCFHCMLCDGARRKAKSIVITMNEGDSVRKAGLVYLRGQK